MANAKRYLVAKGQEFNYPTPASLKIIEAAGGRSKLTDEDKKRVMYKTVKSGEDCSDMPQSSLEIFLERGWVIDSKPEVKEAPTPVEPVITKESK